MKAILVGISLLVALTGHVHTRDSHDHDHDHSPARAHVHGAAQVTVIVDRHQISVSLTAPAESLVGFEHAPDSQDERSRVDHAKAILSQPALFSFYSKTGLLRKQTPIETTQLEHHISVTTPYGDNDHETHTEFSLKTRYSHASQLPISRISTPLFSHFDRLETVSVTVISDDRQSHYVLSREHPVLNL